MEVSQSENVSIQEIQSSESPISVVVTGEPKLFANKFKTVEELEKAYGNAVGEMVKKSQVEKELEKYKSVPESYNLPEDINFNNDQINEISEFAKKAKLNQEQFEMASRNMYERILNSHTQVEERKKQIGEEKLTLLNDYVEKNYPQYARDIILNKLIRDESAMNDALKDRDERLNSQAPGINQGNQQKDRYDGESELRKVAMEYHRNPRDTKLRDKYINMAAEVGRERQR